MVRFVHAAGFRLGRVPCPAVIVAERLRQTMMDAAATSWMRAAEACFDHQADFLLLTGDAFDAGALCPHTAATLIEGLELLAEADIRVIVQPGRIDPESAWLDLDLPANVALLPEQSGEAIAVACAGGAMARLRNLHSQSSGAPQTDEAFEIGLSHWCEADAEHSPHGDCDYVALTGIEARRTTPLESGLGHRPGAAVAEGDHQTGPHGVTLVEVDADRSVNCRFVPTAAVRFDRIEIELDELPHERDVAEKMHSALRRCGFVDAQSLRFVEWVFRGDCDLDESRLRRLATSCVNDQQTTDAQFEHVCRIVEDPVAVDGESQFVEFARTLSQQQPVFSQVLADCIAAAEGETGRLHRLNALLAEVDEEAVLSQALRFGSDHFSAKAA